MIEYRLVYGRLRVFVFNKNGEVYTYSAEDNPLNHRPSETKSKH